MKRFLIEIPLPVYDFFTSKEYREFIWLLFWFGKSPRYSSRCIRFLRYQFFVPDCASFIWQFREIFFEQIYKFTADRPDPVIYDCGANIGTSCLYFKILYPNARIKAFEADPNIFAAFQKNMKDNNILDVEVFNKAVWHSSGKVRFGVDGADGGAIDQTDGAIIQVETIRLGEWLAKEEQVDLLKIDIEGAEYEVIADCRDALKKVRNLFIECHSRSHREQKLDQILALLTRNGFRYYLKNVDARKCPFVNRGQELKMDFQINIFAYRES